MTIARYLVVTDFETTGLDENKHSIIQVARVVYDAIERRAVPGSFLNLYVWPVDNWESRSQEAMAVNRIPQDLLEAQGVPLDEALRQFCTGVDWTRSVIAAWGNDFEMKFLKAAFQSTGRVRPYTYKSFDVRSAAFLLMLHYSREEYLGLEEAARYFDIPVEPDRVHDAAYDVELTCAVLDRLLY